MRSALILFFCGLVAALASTSSGCSGDDEAGTLGGLGVSSGSSGDGGNMCPTDGCGSCPAGETCCNNACVNLNSDIYNCGMCCKSCPNPHQICEIPPGGTAPDCGHAQCNKATNDCMGDQFCCDQSCCTEGAQVCCPNGDGTYGCATPDATGNCP